MPQLILLTALVKCIHRRGGERTAKPPLAAGRFPQAFLADKDGVAGLGGSPAPVLDRAIHIALDDLRLEMLYLVYPGKERYLMHERVEAMPLADLHVLRPNQ
jgi:hypothetical protein